MFLRPNGLFMFSPYLDCSCCVSGLSVVHDMVAKGFPHCREHVALGGKTSESTNERKASRGVHETGIKTFEVGANNRWAWVGAWVEPTQWGA